MRAILSVIVFVNVLRVACAPLPPVDLDWSNASDYHAQGSDEKVPDGKYTDGSQEVQNIKNAHALGNKYIESMEKIVADPHKDEHKKILVHNFGEHHDIDQIKEGVKKLKEGKIGVNNVRKQGVSGKASISTSGSSAGLVTFKDGFHKLKTDDDRAGTFVHEASHALVGTLDRYREDKEKGHYVPITKKEHNATPKDQKVVLGYLKDHKVGYLTQDPNMKSQMHKNADSWKAFGHHAYHNEPHPMHPMKDKKEPQSIVSNTQKRPNSDTNPSDGERPKPTPTASGSKPAPTTQGKTRQIVQSKAGSSNTRQISNKLPQSSASKKSSTAQAKASTLKKTASSRPSLTNLLKSAKSRFTKQSPLNTKSTSKQAVLSSKKSNTSGLSGASKVGKPLAVTRKNSPAATQQKSKTSRIQALASSLKQKKTPSNIASVNSKTLSNKVSPATKVKHIVGANKSSLKQKKTSSKIAPVNSKSSSRVSAATIKNAVGATKKRIQKPSSKLATLPKVTTPLKAKKQVLPKVRPQKTTSTSGPATKMQQVTKSKGRK